MYGDFAKHYDKLMLDYDYSVWAEFIKNILYGYNLRSGHGLDLACGSGEFTIRLSKAGYSMAGVDISNDMLNIARDKARMSGLDLNFINQDIRMLETFRRADFALIMCDGVNYITEGLSKAFNRINKAINMNGLLIFDISTSYKLTKIIGNNIFFHNEDPIMYIWNNEADIRNKLVYMDLTFFERTVDGLYKKFNEEHIMRIYSENEIINALKKSGFELKDILGDGINPYSIKSERIHFIAKKVAEIEK